MGNWYASITIPRADPAQVVQVLRDLRRTAYVTPSVRGCVLVFDRDIPFDDAAARPFCEELSRLVGAPVVLAMNADDDALCLMVTRDGAEVAFYDSTTPGRHGARALCWALGRTMLTPVVWVVLQAPVFVFEVTRHMLVARLLGLPGLEAAMSYEYIEEGEVIATIDPASMTHVKPER